MVLLTKSIFIHWFFRIKGPDPIELTDDGIISAVNLHTDIGKQEDEAQPGPSKERYTVCRCSTIHDRRDHYGGSIAKMAELTAKEIYSIRESAT